MALAKGLKGSSMRDQKSYKDAMRSPTNLRKKRTALVNDSSTQRKRRTARVNGDSQGNYA